MQSALFDPQTAGGLLISVKEEVSEKYLEKIENAKIIGRVKEYSGILIEVA
jgi:selenophosphate synthase